MIIGSGIILGLITLGILFLIGLFNKKIAHLVRVVVFCIRRLRLNKRNMRRLPKTAKKIYPVLKKGRGRGLFQIKILKNYQKNRLRKKLDKLSN